MPDGTVFGEHGFGLVVPPEPAGLVYVGADPNAWDAESAEGEAQRFGGWIAKQAERVFSAETARAKLGKLPAARAVVRYRCLDSEIYVVDHTVALSPRQGTIFRVSLYSPEVAYDRHRKVLEQLLKTWKFETFPGNPRCAPNDASH